MLDICTISTSQAVTKIVDEVELHIHFKFPKAVKLCQFLNFSQMWYVACPQDLLDFSLAYLIQFISVISLENPTCSNPELSLQLNSLLLAFIFILLLTQIEGWVGQEECHLSLFKVQKKGKKWEYGKSAF